MLILALPNNVEHKVEAIMDPFRSPAGDKYKYKYEHNCCVHNVYYTCK